MVYEIPCLVISLRAAADLSAEQFYFVNLDSRESENGNWIDVRDPSTRKLLFRFDPIEDRIQIRRGRRIHVVVDLSEYRRLTGTPPRDISTVDIEIR